MVDDTKGTPQKDTTATTGTSQDFNIDLGMAEKEATIQQEPELNLDMDLQLPEAQKNDNRLHGEDEKNKEILVPSQAIEPTNIPTEPLLETQTVTIVTAPQIQEIKEIKEPTIEGMFAPQENIMPVVTPEAEKQEIPTIQEEAQQEMPIEEKPTVSTMIETEKISPEAQKVLKKDMDIIQGLEEITGGGGLAPEATPAPIPPKAESTTFNLDEILNTTTETIETKQPETMQTKIPEIPIIPMMPPFSAPGTQQPAPVQASTLQWTPPQKTTQATTPTIPHASTYKGMRIVIFAGVGIILAGLTVFIIYTMYPRQFGPTVGGDTPTESTGTTATDQAITPTETIDTGVTSSMMEVVTGEIASDTGGIGTTADTGSHDSAPAQDTFTELGQVLTPDTQPVQNDISKVTDYVTQGNIFLAEGKKSGNSRLIMFGLYMTKKGTAFLEKIANNEQIDNLSGYFAQSDKYIQQGNEIIGIAPTTSSTPPANDTPTITPDTGTPPQDNGMTAQ